MRATEQRADRRLSQADRDRDLLVGQALAAQDEQFGIAGAQAGKDGTDARPIFIGGPNVLGVAGVPSAGR